MKMNKRFISVMTLLLILAFTLTACGGNGNGGDDADQPANNTAAQNRLVFASGGTSGTYYPYAGAVATVWQDNVEGLTVDVQATGASAENINLVNNGEAEIAIVQNDVMKYAYDGIETFEGKEPVKGFSTLATVYAEVCQIVLDPAAGIETIADLKDKRVSVGDIGSGVEANSKQILAAAGLTFDDIKAQHLGFGDSASAIKDKALDAAFVTAGIPTTAVLELSSTNNIGLLSLDNDTVQALVEQYPYYTVNIIPGGTYSGVDSDVMTVAVKATIIVSPDLDEELVYNMTKALFENKEAIATAHAKGVELDIQTATEGVSVPLHPGAARYYKEQGITVE